MSETCGTLFQGHEFHDSEGCLKPECHNDAHVFKNERGELIEWEDDYSCTCGCWDDENDLINVCKVYRKVNSIE